MDKGYFERTPKIEGIGAVAIVIIIIIGGVLFFSVGRVSVGYIAIIVDPAFGTISSIGDGNNARYFIKAP